MALGQWVSTVDGWGEIVSASPARFGSTNYRVIGEFGEGTYTAHQIYSEIDDDDTTTDINFHDSDVNDQNGEASSTLAPDENTWLDGGTRLPWNPHPTEEWDGHLTQELEDHDISLKPTKSTDGADLHPDPEDHNSIFEKKHSSKFAYDEEDTDYAEDEDYKDREEGKKESRVGPRQAFVEYLELIEKNQFVREAAWSDVRRKANRLYKNGNVIVEHNDGREIRAKVDGDHGRYEVKVARKNAFGKGITWYDCDCEWGKWAYKRARTFVGRLCSHGLATYFAMQANKQPEKPTKRINDKVERHALGAYVPVKNPDESAIPQGDELAGLPTKPRNYDPSLAEDFQQQLLQREKRNYSSRVPKATPVEHESLAARQGGLMIWDDDLHKAIKSFFPQPPPADSLSADPGAAGAPAAPAPDPAGTIGPDLSTELAQDQPAAPTFDGADSNFMPNDSVSDKVRTAEYSKNPDTDDLFEDDKADTDDTTFNDVDFKEDNDPEYALYQEFWGRSSAIVEAGPYEDAFQNGLDPKALMDIAKKPTTALPEPGNKLPHFIRRKTAETEFNVEEHDPAEVAATLRQFKLNGDEQAAKKIIEQKYRINHPKKSARDEDVDYHENAQSDDHETDYESDPNDDVNGDSDDNGQKGQYQSDVWLDEDEAEWRDHTDDDDDDGPFDKSSSYHNSREADEFNDDADDIVARFQRSAAAQALFSDSDDSGAFTTIATDPARNTRVAGRHFNYAEQQELVDEPGTARHLAELNLDNSIYLD